MTSSREAADDIVQEAFLALYRDLCDGKAIRNPRSWTFGAVRNQVRKRARILACHEEDLLSLEDLDRLAAEPHWPDILAEAADRADLTLSVLTEREKEVVLLRLQSFKYREIAKQLGNSEKSVATLLARALSKLRRVGVGNGSSSIAQEHAR